jgi:Baseplate hub gp41
VSLLFNRKIGLVAYNPPQFSVPPDEVTLQAVQSPNTTTPTGGLDLSEFRIRFNINQSDVETPSTLLVRVYNLSQKTAAALRGEYQRVVLQAGYDYPNGTGVLFDGTIKQVLTGHETNTDSYVDILAADGDIAYNNAIINASLAAGSTPADQLAALNKAMAPYGITTGFTTDLPVPALSRGKVMFGLAKERLRDLANSVGASWSIQNGKLTLIPLDGYRPNEAVVISSATGMVGFPEQTPGGINVTCLLNPKIRIGTIVQIAAEDINQGVIATSGPLLFPTSPRLDNLPTQAFIAKISGAGYYKVLVSEYEGDTRGEPWYSHLVCLAVDIDTKKLNPNYAGAG